MSTKRSILLFLVGWILMAACSSNEDHDAERGRSKPPSVSSFFPAENYYVLAPNAVELSPTVNAVVEVEPNRISLTSSAAEAKALLALEPGDALFGRPSAANPLNELGFLRVVKSVYEDAGKVVVTTRQAELTEVFKELFYASGDARAVLDAMLGAEKPAAPLAPPSQIKGSGSLGSQQEIPTAYLEAIALPDVPAFEPSVEFETAKGGKVVLSGRLDADPMFQVKPGVTLLIWIWEFGFRNFLFTVEGTAAAGFDVDVEGKIAIGKDVVPGVAKTQTGGPRFVTPPIALPNTPVPISLRGEIEPKCSISISGSAKIAIGASRNWSFGRKGLFYDDDSEHAVSHRKDAYGKLLGPTDFGGAACQSGFDHKDPCQHANRSGPQWFRMNWPDKDSGWQTSEGTFQINGGVDANCWIESDFKFLFGDVAGPLVRLDYPRVGGRANLSYGATPGYCFATGTWELYAGGAISAGVSAQIPLVGTELGTTGLVTLASGEGVIKSGPISPPPGDCKGCIATSPTDAYAPCYENAQCCSGKCDKKSKACQCSPVGGSCRGDNDCCNGGSCNLATLRCETTCSSQLSCTEGSWSCLDATHRAQCMKSASGCSFWSPPSTCPTGQVCAAGKCGPAPKDSCGDGVCDAESCTSCPDDCGPCCELDGGPCAGDGDCCDGHCQNGVCQWLSCGGLAKMLSWGDDALCQQPGQDTCHGSGQPSSDCQLCCDESAAPACKAEFENCSTSAECCGGLACTKDPGDNTLACFKSTPAPTCQSEWESCTSSAECCANLSCKKDPGDNTFACQK
jgi:hypothetical protein